MYINNFYVAFLLQTTSYYSLTLRDDPTLTDPSTQSYPDTTLMADDAYMCVNLGFTMPSETSTSGQDDQNEGRQLDPARNTKTSDDGDQRISCKATLTYYEYIMTLPPKVELSYAEG